MTTPTTPPTAPEPLFTLRDGPETVLRRTLRKPGDWVVTKQVASSADPSAAERITARIHHEHKFVSDVCRTDGFLPPLGHSATGAAYGEAQCTLAQLVRELHRLNRKLDPPLVARVLYRVLQALDHLHRNRYGHGGLTADGVFVTPNGDVALSDFVGYKFGTAPVTPEYPVLYRAPELIDVTLEQTIPEKQRASATPPAVRADLYSAGYLALQLLRPGDDFFRLFNLDPAAATGDHTWDVWHGDLSLDAPNLDNALYDVPVALRQVLQPLIEKPPAKRAKLTVDMVLDQIDKLGVMANKMLPRYGLQPDPPKPTADTRFDRVFLRLADHEGLSRVFPAARRVLVGSSSDCDMTIRHTSVASRHAVAVHRGSAGWWVYDLRSEKGTLVDGVAVHGTGQRVRSNQVVKFGAVKRTATVHRGFWFGTKENRLLVTDTLHESRNSTVYRAIWVQKGGNEVALKVFPPEFANDQDAIRRFLRSLPEASRARHANVVSVYRGGFTKSEAKGRRWYMVMRYMPNGSLRDLLAKRGQLTVPQTIQFARHIGAALKAITAANLIHRNINPKCILFDGDMSARLSDFVLCRQEDLKTLYRVTRAGETVTADYAYQPPEFHATGSCVPWFSDQYSLAACAFEAVTGAPAIPSRDRSLPDVLAAIESAPVPSAKAMNPSVPTGLDALLRKALAKNPKDRFPTPDKFLEALLTSGSD